MNDMKKTFQREMKPGTSASDFNAGGTSNGLNSGSSSSPPSSSPSPSPATGGASAFNPGAYGGLGADLPMTTSQDLILMTEVNYKYLKHVIFKFFTSRDYEVRLVYSFIIFKERFINCHFHALSSSKNYGNKFIIQG